MSLKLATKTIAKVKELIESAQDGQWVQLPLALTPGKLFPLLKTDEKKNKQYQKLLEKISKQIIPSTLDSNDVLFHIETMWSDRLIGHIQFAWLLKTGGKFIFFIGIQ